MVQRDYARHSASRRKQQQNKGKKKLLLTLILFIIVAFAVSLFFLKERSPVSKETVIQPETVTPAKKSTLPSRPEEVWSYIKQLETREVPVDDNVTSVAKNVQLTEEQKKILLQLEKDKLAEQAKQKAEEQARLKAMEQEKQLQVQAKTAQQTTTKAVVTEVKGDSKKVVEQSSRKYGLQCGAFKNKTQAEALQGRLVISGFNAFTKSSADWSRVFIGPLESYNAASSAKSTLGAKGINCVVVGM
ncbi:SPOR domain-containing protein [Gallibacterium trehalosifermentans]|uniref:SPOR domain-containing protein n=1 Tax=Gallibacterium trehalosifermentans TaxID=516935 RepID=A0ABV6H0M2_9PAST